VLGLLRIFRVIIPLLAILVCVALIAGDENSSPAASAAGSDSAITGTSSSPDGSIDASAGASEVGKEKPKVEITKGAPPTGLETTDIVTGTGAEAKSGSEVTIHYVLLLHKNGKEVESTWGGKPFNFELGGGTATAGWEQGIEGMREGGRRELVAPANLSYGKAGVPPSIGPNEALVSVIDLLKVKAPAPAQGPAPSP
jgi:peptidylprolyl isomerase